MSINAVIARSLVFLSVLVLPSTATAATDYAETALNIIPSGQYGSFPPPPDADEQALMYDGLTPLFDKVTEQDLQTYFKSQGFGVGPDGPFTQQEIPRPGVELYRDRFNVPHIYADSKEDGIWAAGWVIAEDRGLLLEQARYNARVDAIDAPGLRGIGLVTSLQSFEPSQQTEQAVAKQGEALARRGKEGEKILRDIDTYTEGINAYLEATNSPNEPWTRNDVFALNSLKSKFLGVGGGGEPARTEFFVGLRERLGDELGTSVYNDLRQYRNSEVLASIDGKSRYGPALTKDGSEFEDKEPGTALIDPGSFEQTAAVSAETASSIKAPPVDEASNTLMVTAEKSVTGNPLMVGGPQIGYFYPGLTLEMDMHAGRLQWRGVTSAPFPGYLLIGRGEDFAVTLTSASADVIDTYAHELCGSDTSYVGGKNGSCKEMDLFEAGTLNGEPVEFLTTTHGPVIGYATVDGERVALSQRRSSRGSDANDLIFNRRISNGRVSNAQDFFRAVSKTPQTFNSFYVDTDDIAMYLAGKLPIRPRKADPGMVTWANRGYEWRGFLSKAGHPQGINPADGIMTNWNQTTIKGFPAADNQFGRNSSAGRGQLLEIAMANTEQDGKWDLAGLTGAMNAGATQDVRAVVTVPLLAELLATVPAPNPETQRLLDLLVEWRSSKGTGGSRLDVDLDGRIDHPGAAIMDTAWDGIADALMKSKLGPQLDELNALFTRFEDPPGGQFSGWYQYFDRDIRKLLGKPIKAPMENDYCGDGDLEQCATDIWAALDEARQKLEAEQGPDPEQWAASAEEERISFAPGLLETTIRYTNRPSGIQQLISFEGRRPDAKSPSK